MTIISSSIVLQSILKDGCLYQMEYKGAQNNLLYIILKLHDLGVSDLQLTSVYHSMIRSMDTLLLPKIYKLYAPLHTNNWLDYLGDKDMYSSYLEFFQRQIISYGITDTLDHFFYCTPLSQSIGSQCLPMAHLALGLKHSSPEIIAQALSYAATSHHDTSFLLDERGTLYNNGYFTAHEILVNQVKADPRFGSLSSKLTYRKILKSARELLCTYVYLWELPNNIEAALSELRMLATCLLLSPTNNGRQQHNSSLDITGNLLKSINAMDVLYPNNTCPTLLVRVQFLNVICSYILQGRPNILHASTIRQFEIDTTTDGCIRTLLSNEEADLTTLSVLTALEDAKTKDERNDFYNKVVSSIYLQ